MLLHLAGKKWMGLSNERSYCYPGWVSGTFCFRFLECQNHSKSHASTWITMSIVCGIVFQWSIRAKGESLRQEHFCHSKAAEEREERKRQKRVEMLMSPNSNSFISGENSAEGAWAGQDGWAPGSGVRDRGGCFCTLRGGPRPRRTFRPRFGEETRLAPLAPVLAPALAIVPPISTGNGILQINNAHQETSASSTREERENTELFTTGRAWLINRGIRGTVPIPLGEGLRVQTQGEDALSDSLWRWRLCSGAYSLAVW